MVNERTLGIPVPVFQIVQKVESFSGLGIVIIVLPGSEPDVPIIQTREWVGSHIDRQDRLLFDFNLGLIVVRVPSGLSLIGWVDQLHVVNDLVSSESVCGEARTICILLVNESSLNVWVVVKDLSCIRLESLPALVDVAIIAALLEKGHLVLGRG